MRQEREKRGEAFLHTCLQALAEFDDWLNEWEEPTLKRHFRQLAAIREHLSQALHQAREFADKRERRENKGEKNDA